MTLIIKSNKKAVGTFQKLRFDKILTNGSLMLFDSSKIVSLPVNGSTLNNVAFNEAIETIGSGTEATMKMPVTLTQVATKSAVEFSSKKGLYFNISATAEAGNEMQIVVPDAIRQYILNNPNNSFYASYWSNVTRVGTTSTAARFAVRNTSAPTTNLLFELGKVSPITRPIDGSANQIGNLSENGANTTGIGFRNVGVLKFNGTLPATIANLTGRFLAIAESIIIYRIYIEDLTVSGRTYAQVSALDKSLKDAAFAEGGKFYNDTYSPNIA